MTPHRRIDRWIREHPGKVDAVLAAALWFTCAVPAFTGGMPVNSGLAFAVSTLQLVPLAWRRSRPGASAAVVVAGHLLQLALVPTLLPSQVAVPITVYALAAYGRRWQSFAGLGTGLAGALLATGRYVVLEGTAAAAAAMTLLAMSLVVLVAWTFGDLHRTRLTATRALEERAHRLEVERQQERDLAAADERSRIAREMHDIVAHSLSIVITQADGARYASAADPEVARQTLATIAETGRASLREMRRLLGVLRGDEQASTRPLPQLADLPDLVASARTAGLAVDFAVTGEPRRGLPAGAELAAYRAVQEALTNTVKHAGPSASARVDLGWSPRGLSVSVLDDGRGAGALSGDGAGQGLAGMAERVGLYDGTVQAGPAAGGGFRVDVLIPYTED
ncbi:sensor histidine kinase [Arthrobacter ginkgonis]|uniref:histidine kinase n=1 Tax=Arthrobacter ginkgonis TaxID=1630594 RepID=A0ABP7BVB0_9MICC